MDILREFIEDPLPPSRIDVARAMRLGRLRRRVRTGAAAVSLVALVSTGIVTAPRWEHLFNRGLDRGGHAGISPANSGTAPLTCDAVRSPDPVPPTDHTSFDLLRRQVDASAVTGYQVAQYDTSLYWQRIQLVNATEDSTIEITLYAAGQTPVFGSALGAAPAPVDPTTGTPTEPVDTAPAYWLPGRQTMYQFEVARLGWQWAPGAWAFIAAADTSSYDATHNDTPKTAEQIAALRGIARQVATALRLNAKTPVTSPFTVPVPMCTRLVGTDLLRSTTSNGTAFTRFTLTFAGDGWVSTNPLLLRGNVPTIQVTADSVATPADKPGSATLQVDGHPASGEGDVLRVYGVDGFELELSTPGGEGAVRDLFHSVHIIPGAHEQPSAWTDTPLAR
jgi:hypothetical protein